MEWRQLELLRCVVDSGGFARAAHVAGVSQPAISQAMQRLAQKVGEPLFERQGRRQTPTAKAVELAHAMQAADDSFRLLSRNDASASTGTKGATIRAGLSPAAGLIYGPSMVNTLIRTGSRNSLSIVTGSAPQMLGALMRMELDLVIAPRPRGLNRTDLVEHLMYVSQPVIYCREGHPLAAATSLRAIARAQWVVSGQADTPGNMIEEAFKVRRWTPPKVAVHCADYAMLAQVVARSNLLGALPHPRLVPKSISPGLVPIEVDERLPHYEVCLFSRRQATKNGAAIRKLIAALTATQ